MLDNIAAHYKQITQISLKSDFQTLNEFSPISVNTWRLTRTGSSSVKMAS